MMTTKLTEMNLQTLQWWMKRIIRMVSLKFGLLNQAKEHKKEFHFTMFLWKARSFIFWKIILSFDSFISILHEGKSENKPKMDKSERIRFSMVLTQLQRLNCPETMKWEKDKPWNLCDPKMSRKTQKRSERIMCKMNKWYVISKLFI